MVPAFLLGPLTIERVDPAGPEAQVLLRGYLEEMASRYRSRPATAAEVDVALAEHPSEDLVPPRGLFWLARRGDAVLGCVALLMISARLGEVRRLFVASSARGAGVGRRLMAEVEREALDAGLTRLRLDTRSDLVESRALYLSLGYEEVPAFTGGPYSDRWYARDLPTPGR